MAGTPPTASPTESPAPHAPTRLLAAGVTLALATVAAVGLYTFTQIRDLRNQQTAISERNRKDSLQLLRIQNDLSLLAVAMRDLADGVEPYPVAGWRPAFDRLRNDLTAAIALERTMAPPGREPAQQARLERTAQEYWDGVDRMFALAEGGDEKTALSLIRSTLIGRQRSLEELVSQLLIANTRVQDEASAANRAVYDTVGREILILVAVLLLVIGVAGAWIVIANRRAFDAIRDRTAQLRTLSWHTMRLQEDLQRSVSRELHDDFGQILTAVGTLLGRVERDVSASPATLEKLREVRGIAQDTLERLRAQSQWLHPGMLDDSGLEKVIARSAEQFERQTGIRTTVSTMGPIDSVRPEFAIHLYRILQEALNNVGRHSGAANARIEVTCDRQALSLRVEDDGRGSKDPGTLSSGGIGLVSMRERTELMGGRFQVRPASSGGFAIEVDVPNAAGAVAPAPFAVT
jgi:signal transduction histidine kinase